MPIAYACVARGPSVLAEYAAKGGNAPQVVRRVLDRLPHGDDRRTYEHQEHQFHYIKSDGITYLCVAEEEFGRKKPFAMLEEVKEKFVAQYEDRMMNAAPLAMNNEFSIFLAERMDFYSHNADADKLAQVRGHIDDVRQIMVDNIERVMDRGDRLDELVDRSEALNSQAFTFKTKSTQLKRQMWWKNQKIMIILGIVGLLTLYFIISGACGGPSWPQC
eukprot:Clim_evm66s128 gene=Clim_evmTU66s128